MQGQKQNLLNFLPYCWWFRNPANQLRLVVLSTILYRALAPSQVVSWISSINLHSLKPTNRPEIEASQREFIFETIHFQRAKI